MTHSLAIITNIFLYLFTASPQTKTSSRWDKRSPVHAEPKKHTLDTADSYSPSHQTSSPEMCNAADKLEQMYDTVHASNKGTYVERVEGTVLFNVM